MTSNLGGGGVELIEVSPRDGLQNEATVLDTRDKLELVNRMVEAGARRIEATSFVHPRRVPQMADAEAVIAQLPAPGPVSFSALVLNDRGLDRAIESGVTEVNFVVVATDTFGTKNQNQTTSEAVTITSRMAGRARRQGLTPTVTIAASFGCPFEGEVPIGRVTSIAQRLADADFAELVLADTIGVAVPSDVTARITAVQERLRRDLPLRLHLHDTRHTGVANAVAAVAAGVTRLDCSLGGAGGCPFAPAATGNVATEDLVYTFERMGLPTGFDLAHLIEDVRWLGGRLGHPMPGALASAGAFP